MSLAGRNWEEKTIHGMKIYWLSAKKRFRGTTAVSKEGHADSHLGKKGPVTIASLGKSAAIVNISFYCQLSWL